MGCLISVIIPIYNGSKYIMRIIKDLNSQTINDFEVNFIDDGSVDDSVELLKNVIQLNQCNFDCTLIQQANKGVSAVRNNGIRNASGKYICFVDVDDGLKPGYLNKMYDFIIRYKVDVVFCNIQACSDKDYVGSCFVLDSDAALELYLFGQFKSGVCTLMVVKNLLTENELWFAEGYKYSEDLHMCWRIIACSTSIGLLKETLYLYYNNPDSVMNKFGFDRYDSVLLIQSLEEYFLIRCPRFYSLFKAYAVARVKWSLLWQAAVFLRWSEFKQFTNKYDLRSDSNKLMDYPDRTVAWSSRILIVSEKLFYCLVRFYIIKFIINRKNSSVYKDGSDVWL